MDIVSRLKKKGDPETEFLRNVFPPYPAEKNLVIPGVM